MEHSKEVLDWARQKWAEADALEKKNWEDAFPELKESEDERIRKDICTWLKHKRETCTYPTPKKETLSTWIAYLEKQKEQKPVEYPEKGNEYWFGFNDGKGTILDNPEQFGLYKPAEWSEDDKLHLNNAILAAEKEWGAESRTAKFLKSLRPQPNQEWSEEDERIMNHCIGYINASCLDANDLYKCIDWLESLHRRIKSSDNWKPSEEQIDALMRTITWLVENGNHTDSSTLADLRCNLRKLM